MGNSLISAFFFLLIISHVFVIRLFAQDENNLQSSFFASLPSPTPAALGKYGDIPVSMYTGVPEISVPLYKVSSRTLSLDIKLTYHAGGNKPQEVPGWTGVGWSLDAGGVITRTVMGKPDEYDYFASSPNPGVNTPNEIGYSDEAIRRIVDGQWDSQPDRYFFNFAGRSGQFVFKPDGSVSLGKCEKMKIEEHSDSTFIITIEDGTKYYFENYEITSTTRSIYKSSWWLSKIVSAIGNDTIKFTYSPYFSLKSVSLPWEEHMVYYSGPVSFESSGDFGGHTSAVRLASISAGRETITFSMSDRADSLDKKLNDILINVDGNAINKFHLFYTDNSFERLLLDSLQESGKNNSPLPSYRFAYCGPKLPQTYGGNADHWGYYNACGIGLAAVKFLCPSLSPDSMSAGETNRDPDASVVRAELLTKISYPTGGLSNFDYEPNDCGNIPATTEYSWTRLASCNSGTNKIDSAFFSLNRNDTVKVSAAISASSDCIAEAKLIRVSTGDEIYYLGNEGQTESKNYYLTVGTYLLTARGFIGGVDKKVTASISASLQVSQIVEHKKFISGGIRIRRITQFDAMGGQKMKEYRYVESDDSSRSSGRMVETVPKYAFLYLYPRFNGICAPIPDGYAITISNYPRSGNGLTQGSPVGYSKVTELLGPNGCCGKSIYNFCAHTVPTAYSLLAPYSSNDWRFGQLISEYHYNAAGILQNNKQYSYTYMLKELVVGWVFRRYAYPLCTYGGASGGGWFHITDREECNFESGLAQLASESTTNYDQNGQNPIAFTKQYFFENPSHLQVTRIVETNSDGKRRVTKMRYPLDYPNTSGTSDLTLQALN